MYKILILRIISESCKKPYIFANDNNLEYLDIDVNLQFTLEKNNPIFFSKQIHYIKTIFPKEPYWEKKFLFNNIDQISIRIDRQYDIFTDQIVFINTDTGCMYSKKFIYEYIEKEIITEPLTDVDIIHFRSHYIYYLPSIISLSQYQSILRLTQLTKVNWNVPSNITNVDSLVISGGGTFGFCVLGTLYCFKNMMNNIKYLFGTSSGSVILFFIAFGKNIDEIYDLIFDFELSIIKPNTVSSIITIYNNYSMYNQNKILRNFLENFLEENTGKRTITFRELFNRSKKILTICCTCLNNKKPEYMSILNYPNENVIDIILMSTCLPFVWEPIIFHNKVYVDGGVTDNTPALESQKNIYRSVYEKLLNNEPVNYWDDVTSDVYNNTLIFDIEKDKSINRNTEYILSNFTTYFSSLIGTLVTPRNIPEYLKPNVIVTFVPYKMSSKDFNLDNKDKEELFNIGKKSAIRYIDNLEE